MHMADCVTIQKIPYQALIKEKLDYPGDRYRIISDYLTPEVCQALLSNPNLEEASQTALNVIYDSGEAVGRHMLMPTRLKMDTQVVLIQSGGGHEVCELFQGKGLGKMVAQDSVLNARYPIYIGQLFTAGTAEIHRKMNAAVFEKPLYEKMCNMRSVMVAEGFTGASLTARTFLANWNLKLHNVPFGFRLLKLRKKFSVRQETVVPAWVDSIALHDGHKYMEIHDREWLQWNLDHKFTSNPNDHNFFFAVYDKKGAPVGFYMTKERFEENKKGTFKNLIRGTVVEWGSVDEKALSEADLNLLAVSTFSPKVDKINTVISGDGLDAVLKSYGFTYRGMFQMVFRPDETCKQDMLDQNQWRIRYGGCNTILV